MAHDFLPYDKKKNPDLKELVKNFETWCLDAKKVRTKAIESKLGVLSEVYKKLDTTSRND